MGYQIDTSTQLYVQSCCSCGVTFGMPNDMDDQRRKDGKSFYCPNGHSQSYSETDGKRLKLERERTARLTAQLDQQRAAREAAERRASALRGQVTKIKRRIGKGVCPCCNRSFSALAEHMRTQHPEFVEEPATA